MSPIALSLCSVRIYAISGIFSFLVVWGDRFEAEIDIALDKRSLMITSPASLLERASIVA
jgi:hypothetical protein